MDFVYPPHSLDAEKSVLGSIINNKDSWDTVSSLLTEDDFYAGKHKVLFKEFQNIKNRNLPIDLITVAERLASNEKNGLFKDVDYLTKLVEFCPSSVNLETHAKIVKEKALLREFIEKNTGFVEQAKSGQFEDLDSLINSAESFIYQLSNNKQEGGLNPSYELVKMSMDKIQFLHENQGRLSGLSSGLSKLDRLSGGFQPGEMIVLGARPSMGKTAFSLNLALHAALVQKKSVAYFSVEMSKEMLMMRMLASAGKINLEKIKSGSLNNAEWPRLIQAAADMSEAKLFVDDTSGITPYEMRSKLRKLKSSQGLDIVFIDYLQIVKMKGNFPIREREVAEISRLIKSMAKELEIPVIALAQLNRLVANRPNTRPQISDLRESGSIEQDADIIALIHREEYYDKENPEVKGQAQVIVGKNRNGGTGDVELRWIPEFGLFIEPEGF